MRGLLRFYPRPWRERYGDELLALLADGGRPSLRARLDVMRAGLGQRLRSAGLLGDELPPPERMRAGVLLVLSSWAAFVVAGFGLAKTAEHWQAVTPRADRGTPSVAYDLVLLAAALGTLAVLAGVLLVARPLVELVRAGGWRQVHRPVIRAVAATGLAGGAFAGVLAWAHTLSNAQRNGGDARYGAAFGVVVLLGIGAIALGTRAAVVIAGRLDLSRATLRRELVLAGTTTATMAAMTAGTVIWWASVARAAPSFFGGAVSVRMVVLALIMLGATSTAGAGTLRAARASRA